MHKYKRYVYTRYMSWIDEIKKHYKSQAEFAENFGVSPMVLTQWKKRGVPAKRAKEIEDFDPRIPKHLTRPDLFDKPTDKKVAA